MRAGEGKRSVSLSMFFSCVDQYPEGIHHANCAAALLVQRKVQNQTAMAPKPAKWPKCNDRTASLG